MPHVIVVGGGAMGSAAAWQLARRGAQVTLLEQYEPGHDKGASHGSARIFRLAYPDLVHVRLAQRALTLWRRLEDESGRQVLTLTGGVDHGSADVVQTLHATLRSVGAAAELLSPAAAAERWPGLSFDTAVVFHPTAGRVHADDAVLAFQEAAALRGAEVRHGVRAASVTTTGVTTTEGEQLQADAVVVAAGAWTPLLRPALSGLLRTTQEQPAHFPARSNDTAWPTFIHHSGTGFDAEGGVYGLASADGIKVGFHGIGPVIDPDRRDRTPDPDVLRRLSEYAERWLPGVDSKAGQPVTCLYTLTPDQRFIVDRVDAITVLAGFSGHGFKFASAIGELAATLTLDDAEPVPEFALSRLTQPTV